MIDGLFSALAVTETSSADCGWEMGCQRLFICRHILGLCHTVSDYLIQNDKQLYFLSIILTGSDGEQFKKWKKCDLSDFGCGLVHIR